MTTATLHPLALDYLERLRRAAKPLPADARRDLLAEIEAHLAEAIPPDATEADALNVLERLGEPEEIVAAEAPPAPPEDPRGIREWAAIFLLLFGGFALGIGWVAGLILLSSSRAWSTLDKWIGTLVVPGGLATTVLVLGMAGTSSGGGSCPAAPLGEPVACTPTGGGTSALAIAALVLLALAPVATAIHLARRARAR